MRRLAVVIAAASALSAQSPQAGGGAACTYKTCALLIAPTWNGLAVTRGVGGSRVANLNFFWPRSVAAAMVGSAQGPAADSVSLFARRALRTRRWAALFTDAAFVSGAAAVVARSSGSTTSRNSAWLIAGSGALLAVSVPLQFSADAALSRAVWWHNVRFAP